VLGSIAPGKLASLVLMDDGLDVLETWIDGEPSEMGTFPVS
jgi:N-acetylglucosamine-6-phosphate deacetylase